MSATIPDTHLHPGQELSLTVSGLAYGGEGVARQQGLVLFVPDGLPGDQLRVRIRQMKKNFGRAEILQIEKPAPDRVPPFCPQAKECGGCSWQHLAYPAQVSAKQTLVENALHHVGRFQHVQVRPVVKASLTTGYRHKIQIPLQEGPGGVRAGFYAKHTHAVVPIDDCPVQPALGNRILRRLRGLMAEFHYRGYNEAGHVGDFRHLVIRLGQQSHEALVILVTLQADLPRLQEFAAELKRLVPEIAGVVQNVNPDRTNVILGPEFRTLTGRGFYYETVRSLRYRISADSFFQVNPSQLPALAAAVLEAADLTGKETVADLFCGLGWLTLELARQARMTVGVECVRSAIEDARAGMLLNQMSGVDFIQADAAAGAAQLEKSGFRPEVAVLDPPRKGCDPELLGRLLAWSPRRIVYVSCNPVTLARDLERLCRGPYHLQSVQPIDLFPHTYHVETVAGLVRK